MRWSLLAGAACNDAVLTHADGRWDIVGDPAEGAMLVVAAKAGLGCDRAAELLARLATIAFSSDRLYIAVAAGLVVAADKRLRPRA